jgi:5-methylcytosine-specific restriction endonuclease McrA
MTFDPKEYARQRYLANRDEIRAQVAAYIAANPEAHAARCKKWQQDNREKVNARQERYRRENPETHRLKQSGYRARRKSVFVEQVHPLIVLERDDNVCGICFEDVDPMNFHVDHIIPLALGGEHSYANVQVTHPFCNHSKGARI